MTLPDGGQVPIRRAELLDELAMLLGGRVAEEIVFGDITTGAQNDIERATKMARQMVTEYGMTDARPAHLRQKQDEVFLGRDLATADYSDAVAPRSTRGPLPDRHGLRRALEILTQHRDNLEQSPSC